MIFEAERDPRYGLKAKPRRQEHDEPKDFRLHSCTHSRVNWTETTPQSSRNGVTDKNTFLALRKKDVTKKV